MQRCAQAEMRMQRCTTCLASAATSATMRKAMVAAATALQRKPYHKATAANPHGPLLFVVSRSRRPLQQQPTIAKQ